MGYCCRGSRVMVVVFCVRPPHVAAAGANVRPAAAAPAAAACTLAALLVGAYCSVPLHLMLSCPPRCSVSFLKATSRGRGQVSRWPTVPLLRVRPVVPARLSAL